VTSLASGGSSAAVVSDSVLIGNPLWWECSAALGCCAPLCAVRPHLALEYSYWARPKPLSGEFRHCRLARSCVLHPAMLWASWYLFWWLWQWRQLVLLCFQLGVCAATSGRSATGAAALEDTPHRDRRDDLHRGQSSISAPRAASAWSRRRRAVALSHRPIGGWGGTTTRRGGGGKREWWDGLDLGCDEDLP